MSNTMYLVRRHALLPLLLAAVVVACAEAPKPPPEEAYRRAVEEERQGHHQEAKRLFEQVRDADTPVRLEFLAEIGIADALYKDRKYEEAAAEYSHLFDIHSGDAIADYLKYQLGMCYYRRIDTIDRDQGLTRRARNEFMELVTRYPESALVPAARENLRMCNEFLAKRELYVGDFYFTKGNYRAAKTRYQRGIKEYGRVDAIPQLLHRLALAEDALGEVAAAQKTAKRLAAEYPDDPWNQNLAAALEEQRQRLAAEAAGEGLINRVRNWWSEEEEAAPVPRAGVESKEAPPAAEEPSAPPPATGTEEASPASQPEGRLGDDARSPVTVSALDAGATTPADLARWRRLAAWLQGRGVAEAAPLPATTPTPASTAPTAAGEADEEPWPGSTVATVDAAPPVASPPRPSRWRRFLTWLHGPAETPEEEASRVTAASPAPAPPGLIVRRIPPVVDDPPQRVPVIPEGESVQPTAVSAALAAPAPEPTVETAPAPAHATEVSRPDAPPPEAAASLTTAPVHEPSAESAPVSLDAAAPLPEQIPPTVAAAASPSPALSTGPATTDVAAAGQGGLVVEEFPATDDGEETGLPAVQHESVTPNVAEAAGSVSPEPPTAESVSPAPRPSLAERVDEAIAAAGEPPTTAPSVPVTTHPVPTTVETEAVAVSGQGTRNQPPRPLPLPAYTRPTPLASGEAGLFPAAIAGRRTETAPSVEWRPLTPLERSSPVAEPVGEVALPAVEPPQETPAERPAAPDFWRGLRDAYGRLAQSEE